LRVEAFRNIEALELVPAGRLNVIAGDNGQGKTSLIEALYVVATSRSFRTNRLVEVVRAGASVAQIALRTNFDGQSSEQRGRVHARGRSWILDGKKPKRLVDYATRSPVVVFHPGDLALVAGPAQGRRTLLDRLALFADPASADARLAYVRALRSRQRILEERGTGARELSAVELVVASYGARLSRARALAAERLGAAISVAFAKLSANTLELSSRYLPGGDRDESRFSEQLLRRRGTDRLRRSASFGPQRDDLDLAIDGRAAKSFASQGQQRLLALSLKLGELHAVADMTQVEPILLLDDVSSELDPTRTGAVYDFLRDSRSQVFVTTTRPDLLVTPPWIAHDRADFVLRGGKFL
jgi:DNA replication and repair protein RecF